MVIISQTGVLNLQFFCMFSEYWLILDYRLLPCFALVSIIWFQSVVSFWFWIKVGLSCFGVLLLQSLCLFVSSDSFTRICSCYCLSFYLLSLLQTASEFQGLYLWGTNTPLLPSSRFFPLIILQVSLITLLIWGFPTSWIIRSWFQLLMTLRIFRFWSIKERCSCQSPAFLKPLLLVDTLIPQPHIKLLGEVILSYDWMETRSSLFISCHFIRTIIFLNDNCNLHSLNLF